MNSVSKNIDSIDIQVVSEIQQRLDLYDITSLVFLLYDVPYTALERLTLLQRVSDTHGKNLDSIYDWVRQAQNRSTWKYEFLEALCICQLYSVIKQIGFDVADVKKHFLPDNMHVTIYVDPIKKVLYKICESIQAEELSKLKDTLTSYHLDVNEYEACELIFLKLMVQKFIIVSPWRADQKVRERCEIEKLAVIFKHMPGLTMFAIELYETANYINNDKIEIKIPEQSAPMQSDIEDVNYDDFRNINELIKNTLSLEENLFDSSPKLKTDTSKLYKESYTIINTKRLGVCYIINQEKFHPSKESIEKKIETLENRKGTEQDKIRLENTMKSYKFEVISDKNLTHQQITKNIKDVIKNKVLEQDSMFMLCILSHGIEGCIYGSDSVPIEVKNIQNILDSDVASKLHGKPKVLIIQACQGSLEEKTTLVPDGPQKFQNLSHTLKSDFLVYWATVPDLLAYRDEKKGSIFIQMLCHKIDKYAVEEHLYDIFTKVNESVTYIGKHHKCSQVPVFHSTLRKKLYFQFPSLN